MITVARLSPAEAKAAVPALAEILVDCVAGGASVGFMAPYGPLEARAFYEKVTADVEANAVALFAASLDGHYVGTVQLGLALPPNQPHRAEIRKMLVHRAARGRGVASALIRAAEALSKDVGRWLIVLDTVAGSDADRLYAKLGWRSFGTCPDYALFPDGPFCDSTHYFRDLREPKIPSQASGVTFRDATDADLPAILAIVNDAILNTTALWIDDPVDLDNRRAWFEARRSQGYPVIVAERDGQVAGFGSYGAFRTGDGYRNSVEHSIYVRSDLRGQGIGAPLLRALEDLARAQGKRAMIGGVEGSNAASLQLHRKLGFVDSGRLPHVGFKFGRWLDLVFMTKVFAT